MSHPEPTNAWGLARSILLGFLLYVVALAIGWLRLRGLDEPGWGVYGALILPAMAALGLLLAIELFPNLLRAHGLSGVHVATLPILYALILRVVLELYTTARGSLGLNGAQEAAMKLWGSPWSLVWLSLIQAAALAPFWLLARRRRQ